MADQPIARSESYQYPSAHIGHLSDNQQKALDSFKKLSEERGYYQPAGKDGRTYASHDDETLLRYLRARKFDAKQGFTQFKTTEDWRKENRLEEYYDKIDINEYEAARRMYPQWTGRRDKRGIPVYLFEVVFLDSKTVNNFQSSLAKDKSPPINPNSKTEPKMLRLFALYENLTRFIFPLCSSVKNRPHPETPISQSSNIVDISNVGLRQFWNLKAHMQDASTLATAHYPETLDRIFVIGAPSFFPTVWSWVKRWFDPITVSKIFILSQQEILPTLSKYIELENIPKKYGGGLDYKFGDLPLLEPAIAELLSFQPNSSTAIPIGPIKWREISKLGLQAIAVGSVDGRRREDILATIRNDYAMIHGISRTNTAVDWSKEIVDTSDGRATQPAEGDPNYGRESADEDSGSNTPAGVSAGSAVNLPIRSEGPKPGDVSEQHREIQSPANAIPRTGTSAVKAEQQEGTHAEGQMAKPHIVDYGGGDKATIVEPLTVGQARKDTNLPKPEVEEEPAKGIVTQAQEAVGSVTGAVSAGVGSVLSAVGITGEKKETVDPQTVKEKEEREKAKEKIEISREQVEEHLKNQSVSH